MEVQKLASSLVGHDGIDGTTVAGLSFAETIPAKPTLIVLCGNFSGTDLRVIQTQVRSRVASCFPLAMLEWIVVPGLMDTLGERIERALEPLRNLSEREQLADEGTLDRTPANDELPIRVIVVVHVDVIEARGLVEDVLNALQREFESISGLHITRPTLIGVGDEVCNLTPSAVEGFWPRFRMGRHALGGALASTLRLTESVGTLLVALLVSEFVQVLETQIPAPDVDRIGDLDGDPDDPIDLVDPGLNETWSGLTDESLVQHTAISTWIATGASALSVNIPEHLSFMRHLAYRHLMQPFVRRELSADDMDSIQALVAPEVESFLNQEAMMALNVLPLRQWDIQFGHPGRSPKLGRHPLFRRVPGRHPAEDVAATQPAAATVQQRRIYSLRPASAAPFRPSPESVPEDLQGRLTDHYLDLRAALVRLLPLSTQKEVQRLVDAFGSFLLPVVSEEGQELPRPWGLRALITATEAGLNLVQGAADLQHLDSSVLPYLQCNDLTCASQADADAWAAQAQRRRYQRLARSRLTSLGMLLFLLPAWLVLSALLTLVLPLSPVWAATLSAILIAFVGLYDYWSTARDIKRLAQDVETQQIAPIGQSVLRMIAWWLWEQRRALVSRLQEALFLLRQLETILNGEYQDAVRLEVDLQNQFELDRANGSVYRLSNLALCRQWAEIAVEKARQDRLLSQTLRDCLAPLLTLSGSYRRAAREIRDRLDALADEQMNVEHLMPYVLADREELLAAGRRWRWLHDRAHPLGYVDDKNTSQFTIMIYGEPAAIVTATGESSEYWQSDWKTARSRQPTEIICVRGVIDGLAPALPTNDTLVDWGR